MAIGAPLALRSFPAKKVVHLTFDFRPIGISPQEAAPLHKLAPLYLQDAAPYQLF